MKTKLSLLVALGSLSLLVGCTNDTIQAATLTVLETPVLPVQSAQGSFAVPVGIAVYARVDVTGPKGVYPGQFDVKALDDIVGLVPDAPEDKPDGSSSCVRASVTDKFLVFGIKPGTGRLFITPSSGCSSSGDSGDATITVTVTAQ